MYSTTFAPYALKSSTTARQLQYLKIYRYHFPMAALTFFEVSGSWLSVSAPAVAGNISDPVIEPVSGLVVFTPRLPRGKTFLVNDYLVTGAHNMLQQVWLIANPNRGTFRLELDGFSTPALPYTATPAAVQTALRALPSINGANVTVTAGPQADSFNVEFTGALANTYVSEIVSHSNLHNALDQSCPIEVTVVRQGTPEVVADTAIALPDIMGRIWHGVLSAIDSVDSPGVKLTANSAALNNNDPHPHQHPLIYDVTFLNVSFNGEDQVIAPFAFEAPTDDQAIRITDPDFVRLPYAPITQSPVTAPQRSWRLRAV